MEDKGEMEKERKENIEILDGKTKGMISVTLCPYRLGTEMIKGIWTPDFCTSSSLTGEAWPGQGCGWFRGVDRPVAPLFHGPEATRGGVYPGRGPVTIESFQPRARLDTDFTPRCLFLSVVLFAQVPFQKETAYNWVSPQIIASTVCREDVRECNRAAHQWGTEKTRQVVGSLGDQGHLGLLLY